MRWHGIRGLLAVLLGAAVLVSCDGNQSTSSGAGASSAAPPPPSALTPAIPSRTASDSVRVSEVAPALFAALANTSPATAWFYFRDSRNGVWYIANPSGQIFALDAVGPAYTGNVGWQPINNGASPGYPAAGVNFSAVNVSADGRTVSIGSANHPDLPDRALALENTTQTVAWLYFQDSRGWWYISQADSAAQVFLLADAADSIPGGIGWQPVYNASFTGYPSAGQNFATVAVAAGRRATTFGNAAAAYLVATPDSVTLHPGESAPVQVQALDALGRVTALPSLTWQSLTSGVTVSPNGVITASAGITSDIPDGRVQASADALMVAIRVAVITLHPTATLSASPSSITLGQSTTLTWSSTDATTCTGSWTATTWPRPGATSSLRPAIPPSP